MNLREKKFLTFWTILIDFYIDFSIKLAKKNKDSHKKKIPGLKKSF